MSPVDSFGAVCDVTSGQLWGGACFHQWTALGLCVMSPVDSFGAVRIFTSGQLWAVRVFTSGQL